MIRLDTSSRQHVPFRRIVPNMLTTVSLCSGLASIHYALKAGAIPHTPENAAQIESLWKTSMMAIGVAAVFDLLDGRAARLLKASSRFGAVLDSLSDFLSFGVAPALLLHQWMLRDHGALGMAAVLVFVLCAALRLARFTAMPKQPAWRSGFAKFFSGLPTPAAAGAVLVPPMLNVAKYFPIQSGKVSDTVMGVFESVEPSLVVGNTFLVAILMISRVPMFSFKKFAVHRSAVVPLMVAIGLVVLALFRDPWLTVPVIVWAYLFSTALSVRSYRRVVAESIVEKARSVRPAHAPPEEAHA
ncbi:MAG: phosphatidylcholine/phosphatidylserine synthase [Phycisphaeraceae bacterium]|nr:MAG: phosphatidylcholine/phosphatidylserine synthase [Phycisphaeraceae bacterium]